MALEEGEVKDEKGHFAWVTQGSREKKDRLGNMGMRELFFWLGYVRRDVIRVMFTVRPGEREKGQEWMMFGMMS